MAKKAAPKTNDSDISPVSEEAAVEETTAVAKKTRAPRKKASVATADKPVVKRTRKRKVDSADPSVPAPVMKAFWGVFNPMMVQVAQYDYAEQSEAQKAAADLTEKKKAPHFVQIIKKVV